MKALFIILALYSVQAHALYVAQFSPSGDDVDSGTEIQLTFDSEITSLGKKEVPEEQLSKISIKPAINCQWRYENLKTLKCMPGTKLIPATKYQITVLNGFEGHSIDNRLSQDQVYEFKTSDLSILSYKTGWSATEVIGEVILNHSIKNDGLSGKIQCLDKVYPVKISLEMDNKVQLVRFTASSKDLPTDSCVFYFDQPLTLLKYPLKGIPKEKVLLSKEVSQVATTYVSGELTARCRSRYDSGTNLYHYSIPQLSCEASDAVTIEINPDNVNWKKLIKVTPSHGVELSKDSYGYLSVSGFRANSTYIITVPKSVSKNLKTNVVVQLDGIDSPPLLGSKKNLGVVEKHGPWQVPYSALNIQSLEVTYDLLNSKDTLGKVGELHSYKGSEVSETISLDLKENQNTLLPLELKKLAKDNNFSAGFIAGTAQTKDVDAKYLEAQNILVTNEWERENRDKFNFAFLVTDIGLHLKISEKGVLVWATSLKTGKPIKGVNVTLFSQGVEKSDTETDKYGLAYFPDYGKKHNAINIVAKRDDDISFINTNYFWERGISLYEFNLKNYYDSQDSNLVADVVAERPLYLPGEKVELKFFVREAIGDTLELKEAGKSMEVVIRDARDEEILKKTIELNSFGTGVIGLSLDPKAATGDYTAVIKIDDKTLNFSKAFSVQEFRKPEIKVAMEDGQNDYSGKVTYYSGGDMQNAEGQLAVLFKESSFKPQDVSLKKFSFPKEVGGSAYYWDYYYRNTSSVEVISRTDITTNDKGSFSISKAEIQKNVKKYGTVTVEAIFKDSAGGSVAGRVSTLINPYKHIPGIELAGWYYSAGDKVNPKVVALDPQGKPAFGLNMELEVDRVEWIYERRLGSGNYFYTDSRREDKNIFKCKFKTNQLMSSCDINLKDGGEYIFKVKVAGVEGLSPATTWKWVMSDDYLGYKVENHDRINVEVENNQLKLGDKVRLMAMAPFSDGEALITFERNGILHKEQVSFKGNVLIFEKVLNEEKFIPGFYASIVMIKGRTSDKIEGELDLGKPQFKMGYARVEVALAPKKLAVTVTPVAKLIKPGEEMQVSIDVKDYQGKGVFSELAIAVVDDSLLSLAGNYSENYDILDTFYSLKKPKVDNYQTLTQLIGRRVYGKKGSNPGGGGGFALRSDFKNTAYWIAQVTTDKKGRHNFKFKVPDNLTTWKILAVSVDEAHRFGFGEGDFLATKPLTIEPILPNFLIEGDKFQAQVSVANRSGEIQNVLVKPSSEVLSFKKTEEKLTLQNGSRSSVLFPVETPNTQKADVSFIADSGTHKDGFKVSIPVERQSLNHVLFTNGLVQSKPVSIPVSLPGDMRKDSVNLTVEYSHTAMNGLDEVFKYVLGYPYGCWEQRLSKAYFLVQYEQFKNVISYRFPETEGSISKSVQDLLNLASDYQTPSGGMRYYPGGQESPDIYLSIFTAYSFNIMKKVGYKINSDVEAKLKSYLRSLITGDAPWRDYYDGGTKNSNKALILSVLTEMGETNLSSIGSKLYADRNGMDLFALSFLGGFLNSSKGFEAEAKNVFGRLSSLKQETGGKAFFKEPIKTSNDWKWWSYTDTRSQCAALQNLVPYTDDKALAGGVVREILSRMKDGHWYNTQENIYCFEGLRRFVAKFEAKGSASVLGIKVNNEKISKEAVRKQNVRSVALNAEELKGELKKVELEASSSELYYSTTVRFETPYKDRAPINEGFELKKEIFRKNGNAFTALNEKILKVKQGDTLKIVLQVTVPTTRYQVMLNDRLAAAFEPINMKLATSSEADAVGTEDATKSRDGGYVDDEGEYFSPWFRGTGFEFMDLRLNAAQFYSRKLTAGTYKVEYLVQVRTAGEFSMPESVIEEMYYPEVRGTFSGKKVIVEN